MLLSSRPIYCESTALDFTSVKTNIQEGIDKCINSWSLRKVYLSHLSALRKKIATLESTNIFHKITNRYSSC